MSSKIDGRAPMQIVTSLTPALVIIIMVIMMLMIPIWGLSFSEAGFQTIKVDSIKQPHKVLIIVTSHGVLGNTNYPTGLWLPEMTHPYYALRNAGLDVVIASPKGGNIPIDPYSIPS